MAFWDVITFKTRDPETNLMRACEFLLQLHKFAHRIYLLNMHIFGRCDFWKQKKKNSEIYFNKNKLANQKNFSDSFKPYTKGFPVSAKKRQWMTNITPLIQNPAVYKLIINYRSSRASRFVLKQLSKLFNWRNALSLFKFVENCFFQGFYFIDNT